jgi:hypothetical protein
VRKLHCIRVGPSLALWRTRNGADRGRTSRESSGGCPASSPAMPTTVLGPKLVLENIVGDGATTEAVRSTVLKGAHRERQACAGRAEGRHRRGP